MSRKRKFDQVFGECKEMIGNVLGEADDLKSQLSRIGADAVFFREDSSQESKKDNNEIAFFELGNIEAAKEEIDTFEESLDKLKENLDKLKGAVKALTRGAPRKKRKGG